MTGQDENVIVTSGAIVIAVTMARDMLPPSRGGLGQFPDEPRRNRQEDKAAGFEPTHLLGGMAATTLLLLMGEAAPELAKAFAIFAATVAFLYGGANVLETFFIGEPERTKQ